MSNFLNNFLSIYKIEDLYFAIFMSLTLGTFINIRRKKKIEFEDKEQRYVYVVTIANEETVLYSNWLYSVDYIIDYVLLYYTFLKKDISNEEEGIISIYDRYKQDSV